MKKTSRRDFLKTASLFSLGALSTLLPVSRLEGNDRPNVIILLFDAMSAFNLSVYGYGRETTPELSKFADRCIVYNAHHSASNFTSSGTASMLTGMVPWKHRAITQGSLVTPNMVPYNPYSLLGDDYYKLAFSQNFWPDRLVGQYYESVDEFLPQTKYSMRGNSLVKNWLGKDRWLASIAFDDFLFPAQVNQLGSSILGYIYKSRVAYVYETQRYQPGYPSGTPEVEGYFSYQNEDVMHGILSKILELHNNHSQYFAYFHLFSPHAPYRPSAKFLKKFNDDKYQFLDKPVPQAFSSMFTRDMDILLEKRKLYDQQIAQIDAEIGKMMKRLEEEGLFENTYIFLTSDHGEMFERGFIGHGSLLLYEPLLRIPLLVHAPGQMRRRDVDIPTSNIDILPTVLSLAGKQIPEQLEGRILPGLGGEEDRERPIFSVNAWENSAFLPLTKASISMQKGNFKLIAYLGYGNAGDNVYELFDLDSDPEEMFDLSRNNPRYFNSLKDQLFDHLSYANMNYVPA